MRLIMEPDLLGRIEAQGEGAYPDEGAGFLLGTAGRERIVREILPLPNAREEGARHNRYLIRSVDYLKAETEAERLEMDVVGVFHSHPDHPDSPSEYDREWAQPNFSYLITSIQAGKAVGSRSWRLAEDRTQFVGEELSIRQPARLRERRRV
jgi:proteasome lid subunit RPN8/RPN11